MRLYYDDYYDDDYYDEDDDCIDDCIDDFLGYNPYSSNKSTIPKQKTEDEILLDDIKKVKKINDNTVYSLIEKIVNNENEKLSNALCEKLDYLGICWYNEIEITNTTDSNQLKKDIIYSFIHLNLGSESELNKFKFVITKIKHFEEWENFFDE